MTHRLDALPQRIESPLSPHTISTSHDFNCSFNDFLFSAKPYLVLHSIVKTMVQNRDGAIKPFYYTFTDGGIFGFYTNGTAEFATELLLVNKLLLTLFSVSLSSHTLSLSELSVPEMS